MNLYYVAAIWLGMALLASVISIRIAVPAALVEIVVGALAGNIPGIREHVTQTHVITFLAGVGSLVLTFLAGAEIDPVSLRGHWKASVSIGAVSFALPFMAAFGFCGLVLGWSLHAAEIGGVALSTTSVAVVYAVMFGLTHGLIDKTQYTELVTVVILSAFVPTLIAQQLFRPAIVDTEEEEALGEEDLSIIHPGGCRGSHPH